MKKALLLLCGILSFSALGLSQMSKQQANKCDERMENYAEAIAWYEDVLTDPATSFNDSIFAAIDLGDLYLRLGEGGEKGICGKWDEYQPVTDFIVHVGEADAVSLAWGLPFGQELMPMTLSWTASASALDSCAFGHDSFMAQMFDSQDLKNFIGWTIDSLLFNKTSTWTHALYVWEKEQGGQMEVVYAQLIPDGLPMGENIIRLEEELHIAPNSQYWIGYKATFEEGQHGRFPFSTDFGPVVENKGGLMMDANHPTTWHGNPYSNLWMKVFVSNQVNGKYFDRFLRTVLDGYRIYRDGQLIREIPYSFVTYYTDTEFTKGIDVEYCVTAVYGDVESEPVCATAIITGVGENPKDNGFTLSPNPTSGIVRIEGITAAETMVCDVLGQLLKTAQNTNEIDLKGLPQGVYLLRVVTKDGTVFSEKVVKE